MRPNLDSREPFLPSSYSCEHCGGIVLVGSLCECETWDYDDSDYDYEDYEEYLDDVDPGDMDGDHESAFESIGWGCEDPPEMI